MLACLLTPLTLAAPFDWTQAIYLIVLVAFAAMRYFLSELGSKKAAPKPKPQRPAPNPQQQELRNEVEDFLRHARGLPPKEREQPQPRRGSAETVLPKPVVAKTIPPQTRRLEQIDDPYQGSTVGEHVSQHVRRLAESQLAENAAHLGEELSQTDERLDARLHSTFEHKLGRLRQRELPAPEEVDPVSEPLGAAELAAMLSTPEGIRNAILLNEILQRPVERW